MSTTGSNDMPLLTKCVIALLPLIIATGVVGNIINIIIFSRKQMRRSSTFYFLIYLSSFDLLVLLICASDVFLKYGLQVHIRHQSLLLCRLHTFLTYFLIHASSFILMIISIDRALIVSNKAVYFTVFRPRPYQAVKRSHNSLIFGSSLCCMAQCGTKSKFKRGQFNKRCLNRMDLIVGLTLSLLAFLNIHYLFFMNINSMHTNMFQQAAGNGGVDKKLNLSLIYDLYDLDFEVNEVTKYEKKLAASPKPSDLYEFACYPPKDSLYYAFLSKYFIWLDMFVYSFVPCAIMVICSAVILYRIKTSDNRYLTNVFKKNNRTPYYKRLKRNRQLLYMLLITNLYFLLSSLPYCVSFLLYRGETSDSGFGQLAVHVLSYTNNAFNFIFYGVSSQKYREQFSILFGKGKHQGSGSHTNLELNYIANSTNLILMRVKQKQCKRSLIIRDTGQHGRPNETKS